MSEMSRPCGHHGRAALFKKAWESIQKYIVGANSTRALCQRNRRGVGHLFSNCMALKPLYQSNYAFGGSGGNRNPPDAFASFCIGKRRPPVGCNQEMAAAISSDPNYRYGIRRSAAPVHTTAEAATTPPHTQTSHHNKGPPQRTLPATALPSSTHRPQPNITSRIIMAANPMMMPMVA